MKFPPVKAIVGEVVESIGLELVVGLGELEVQGFEGRQLSLELLLDVI